MNNDQFLQYYLEKQAARTIKSRSGSTIRQGGGRINPNNLPPSAKAQFKRTSNAVNYGNPRTDSAPPKASHPSRQVQEPNFVLKGKPQTVEQATRPPRPVQEGAGEPDFPIAAAGPRKDVTPLGYRLNRMNAWVRRNKVPLAWGGAGTAAAATLGTAGYMMSGDDAAPTPATTAKTTDPNAAPEVNTPKQEDNESWWADVLAWIKENPELAMLVLGGGGLGIGALLGSR